MKKLVPFLFSFFLLLSFTNLNAQCSSGPPCIPDCPADQFSPIQTIDVEIAPGCTLRVTYASRIACGTYNDYYLSGVRILTFQNCPFAASDVKTIVELAFAGLLDANPANFPPLPPGASCNTNWRAGKGACWEQAGDCIVPCTPLVCCLNSYTVCIDASGNKTITPTGVIGPPPGSCTGSCIDVCN